MSQLNTVADRVPNAISMRVTPKVAAQYAGAERHTVAARIRIAHGDLYRRAYLAQTYSPMEYFAQLGKDGKQMIDTIRTLGQAANALEPGSVPESQIEPPTSMNISIDNDGNVTMG